MKCNCTHKREVRVMDYDKTSGICLVCYGNVDLTPDPDLPKFFLPAGDAKVRFLDDWKFPKVFAKSDHLYVGRTIKDCPFCEAGHKPKKV